MSYIHVFEFERNFDVKPHLEWFHQNWTISLWLSAAYVMLVFGGKKYMETRERFELRFALAVWSSVLAVFSIVGSLRTVPDLFYHSFRQSICDDHFYLSARTSIWGYAFGMSKVLELGDTLFIVLRKQPLLFLHWYHHITVLIYCFYSYSLTTASGGFLTTVNYAIHAIMYSYYALKAFRVSIPRWVNIIITSLQLIQMVVGVSTLSLVLYYQKQGYTCNMGAKHIFLTYAMYTSYLVLFSNFFYHSYVKPRLQHIPKREAYSNNKAKKT